MTDQTKAAIIQALEHIASTQCYLFEIVEDIYNSQDARILNAREGLEQTAEAVQRVKNLLT